MKDQDHLVDDLLNELEKPSVYQLREKVIPLLARLNPPQKIPAADMMSLVGYHWPKGEPEQQAVLQFWMKHGILPVEYNAREKIEDVFSSLVAVGLGIEDLETAIHTCFPHLLIYEGEIVSNLQIRFREGYAEFGAECVVDTLPAETVFSDIRLKQSIKSFFQLSWGREALIAPSNLFTTEPFGKSVLPVIKAALQDIQTTGEHAMWKIGEPHSEINELAFSYSPGFSRSQFMLVHFQKQLTPEQHQAVKNFLLACVKCCDQATVDIQSLPPLRNEPIFGHEKLCRAFSLGKNSFTQVKRMVDRANSKLSADRQIKFQQKRRSPGLTPEEIVLVKSLQ